MPRRMPTSAPSSPSAIRPLQQRQQHDNFLLTTYTSTKDIERLRDERLDQLDGQIKAANAYIESLDGRLKALQARALLFKPYSKKPDARRMPDDLAEQLVRTSNDLRTQHKAMDKRLQDQTEVRSQFEADISRYRELTASALQQLARRCVRSHRRRARSP